MKLILYYLSFSIIGIALFSSCISSEEINYLQDFKMNYPLEPYKQYKLAVGDVITCSISSSDEELTTTFNNVISVDQSSAKTFSIYEDGTVILPYFGTVKIEGLTVQQAEALIQEEMQKSILDAQVKVSLASNFFYVLSSDKKGSYYVYKDNMTIYQALAISEQTTATMDLTKVSIVRKDKDGNSITKTFDLRTQDVIQSEYYYIQPNDLIYFPTNRNSFFSIISLSSFITAVMIPLTFLIYAATYTR